MLKPFDGRVWQRSYYEHVVRCEQDLNEILESIAFCDKIIFGRLNYNKKVSEYRDYKAFFNRLSEQVIAFCEANGKAYHIKDGTITE